MTAHAMAGDAEKSLAAGMNDHVTKPIDPAELFAALQKWIGPREAAEVPAIPQDAPPQAREDELPDTLPGFDLSAALERLMGNRRLYRKLLADFGRECREAGPLLHDAYAAGDFSQVDQLAHRLKGAAGNLGATQVQEAALALETLAKEALKTEAPPQSELQMCARALEDAIESALAALETIGLADKDEEEDAKSSGDEAALPDEIRVPLAKRLREAAVIGDIMTLNAMADELLAKGDAFEPLSRSIASLAGSFDFEGLEQLAETLENPDLSTS
jgi:HPt (histidine-containing phosphotransfer) domain-containing protein